MRRKVKLPDPNDEMVSLTCGFQVDRLSYLDRPPFWIGLAYTPLKNFKTVSTTLQFVKRSFSNRAWGKLGYF